MARQFARKGQTFDESLAIDERLLSLTIAELAEKVADALKDRDKYGRQAQKTPAYGKRRKKLLNKALSCATLAIFLTACAERLHGKQLGRVALFGPQAENMPALTVRDLGIETTRELWHNACKAIAQATSVTVDEATRQVLDTQA